MKRHRAEGSDGIAIEILSGLTDFRIDIITEIINEVYDSCEILENIRKSINIMMPKKPGGNLCEHHRKWVI